MNYQEAIALIGILGFFLAIGAQIRLIMLIMRNSPPLALAALVVPFMTWLFADQNWDIAKRSIITQFAGILTVCAAAPFAG